MLINLPPRLVELNRVNNPNKGIFGRTMDEILTYFNSQNVKSVIVDIRSDAGGAVYNGTEIASRFVTDKKKFYDIGE